MEFRYLKADEIELRVAQTALDTNNPYITALLYKDARCDMKILDEIIGSENWQRKHYECKGNLFCSVGIKIESEWIWKDDCGSESRTEAEKGESSDSFKRACFNWGIGRELYTSPFIYIPLIGKDEHHNFDIIEKNGKKTVKINLQLTYIKTEDGKITALNIENTLKRRTVFTYGECFEENKINDTVPTIKKSNQIKSKKISIDELENLRKELIRTGGTEEKILKWINKKDISNINDISELSDKQYIKIMSALELKAETK